MKLTAGESTRGDRHPAARDVPIHAPGAAVEGPRPSGAGSPICPHCGQPTAERACARPGCRNILRGKRPDARYCSRACNQACRRDRKPTRSLHKRSGPSGLQVSYAKALRALVTEFRLLNLPVAQARAEVLMRGLLSDRQRARLDERGSPHG